MLSTIYSITAVTSQWFSRHNAISFQSTATLTFLDVIRFKLSCTIASLDGNPRPSHPLSNNMEQHTDKQVVCCVVKKIGSGIRGGVELSHKSLLSKALRNSRIYRMCTSAIPKFIRHSEIHPPLRS